MTKFHDISAPQLDDVGHAFGRWKENHVGTMDDFLEFMATPSLDRNSFIDSLAFSMRVADGITTHTYS